MARSTNAVLERLPQSGWWVALGTMGGDWRVFSQTTIAYHLAGEALERFELPGAVMTPSWDLEDGRLVKSVATTMSFPPAIPEQFPRLDRPRLEAFSRDLEALGFEKLLDTSPIADSPTYPPNFSRIYAHRRQGCFGIIMQPFPSLGGPIELRSMLTGYLDAGWSLAVSNGKPLPASPSGLPPRPIASS